MPPCRKESPVNATFSFFLKKKPYTGRLQVQMRGSLNRHSGGRLFLIPDRLLYPLSLQPLPMLILYAVVPPLLIVSPADSSL